MDMLKVKALMCCIRTVKTQLLHLMLITYLLTCYMFRPMLGHHQALQRYTI
jgi:hypothetical protein